MPRAKYEQVPSSLRGGSGISRRLNAGYWRRARGMTKADNGRRRGSRMVCRKNNLSRSGIDKWRQAGLKSLSNMHYRSMLSSADVDEWRLSMLKFQVMASG